MPTNAVSANHPRTIAAATAAMLAIGMASPAPAAEFFAGKSIDLLIGAPPAGGYDIYGRALARHTGRHIPGNPTIVAKNMPGAGSARAGGFISAVAPKDGTAIAALMPGAIIGQLLDPKGEALFDPTKVIYLGTANNGTRVCVSRRDSKVKTFDDALTEKAPFGAVSANDSTRDYAWLHKRTAGAQYNVVLGYAGTADIALALERGEIDGACGWDWASFKSQRPDWLRDKKVNVLLQVGREPNEELTRMGVPSVWKYVKTDEARKIVELVIGQQVFQRPYVVPPGTPAEQVAILRKAFDATMTDPQFLEEAAKLRIDISQLPGSKVQEVVQALYATPKDVVEQARRAINP
jgi:tripartite-type tricarboxylate transporter receptor subunit TctC